MNICVWPVVLAHGPLQGGVVQSQSPEGRGKHCCTLVGSWCEGCTVEQPQGEQVVPRPAGCGTEGDLSLPGAGRKGARLAESSGFSSGSPSSVSGSLCF